MIFAIQRPLNTDGNFELKARKTGESLTRIRGGPIFVVFMGSFLQRIYIFNENNVKRLYFLI